MLNKEDAALAIVNPASGEVFGRVPVGLGPHELVVSTDGKVAFASNYGSGPAPGHTISMIDLVGEKSSSELTWHRYRGRTVSRSWATICFTAEADNNCLLRSGRRLD